MCNIKIILQQYDFTVLVVNSPLTQYVKHEGVKSFFSVVCVMK